MIISSFKKLWDKPAVRRSATAAFLFIVALFIVQEARNVEWREVANAVRAYDPWVLVAALGLSGLSYLIYSCFDLLGCRYTRVAIPAASAMSAGFVSFAFNQSLGSLIGAVALRVRLYSRLNVDALAISKIIAFSITTNWLGYCALTGAVFLTGLVQMPAEMGWGTSGLDFGKTILQATALLMLLTVIAYFIFCAMKGGEEITIKDMRVRVPTWRLGLGQLTLSIVHWPTAAAIPYVLLHGQADFISILGALLLTAVAVVLTHIPAGLGVLEAIFVGLLGHRIPSTQILAAVLIFRAVYHLVPLAVAAILYFKMEAWDRNSGKLGRSSLGSTFKQKKHAT